MDWSSIKLTPPLLKAVGQLGFDSMTPVQAATIPLMIDHKDVAVEAVTGSGKTLAFILPTIQILLRREEEWKKHEVGAIIIAPTRELAVQISNVLESVLKSFVAIGKKTPSRLTYILMIGGTQIQADIDKFSNHGGNIIIATPGRLEDVLLRRNDSRVLTAVKKLEVLILDEADCLLNLGFEQQLNNILRVLPKQRRTGLFSATQTTEVLKLIRAGLRNPVSVVVRDKGETNANTRVPASLENYYAVIPPKYKFFTLLNFILEKHDKKILIFFSTCACVEYFTFLLKYFMKKFNLDLPVTSIHGKMKEKIRLKTFEKFRNLTAGIMAATDLLARGIDITERIHWVIQFDPPSNPASFVHRSGRTARAGNEGKAILFLQPLEQDYVEYIKISQKIPTIEELKLYEKYESRSKSKCKADPDSIHEKIQSLQLKDRSIYDRAMRAFVSYFKSYSKYECNLILRTKDLELSEIAFSYGLIKFPRISELQGKKSPNFEEVTVDINSIPYKDSNREESRKRKLSEYNETGKWPVKSSKTDKKRPHQGKAWSVANEKKLKKREKAKNRKLKIKNGLTQQEIEELEKSQIFKHLEVETS